VLTNGFSKEGEMGMVHLSKVEWNVHTYIVGYVRENGYSPTLREIAVGVGYSMGSQLQRVLENLRGCGLIEELPYKRAGRAIVLVRGVEVGWKP
jgi:SOS-response transcriptional repressor LexA